MDRFEEIMEHYKRNSFDIEDVGKITKKQFFSVARAEFNDDYGLTLMEMIKVYFDIKDTVPKEIWEKLKKEAKEMQDDSSVRYL